MRAIATGFLSAGIALAFMGATPLQAQAEEGPKKVEKTIKVIVDDDGKDHVVERGPRHDFALTLSGGGRLGVGLEDVTKEVAAASKLEGERGAVVRSVEPDSAAKKAGVVEGDVIVRFEGEVVRSAAALARMVRETPANRTIDLEIVRGGALQRLSAQLGESRGPFEFGNFLKHMPHPMPPGAPVPPMPPLPPSSDDHAFRWDTGDGDEPSVRILHSSEPPRLGVRLQDVDGQLAAFFKLQGKQGVLVTNVEEESAAARAGVQAGDIVLKLDGTAVTTASELRRAVRRAEGGKVLPLSVWRDARSVELSVTLPDAGRRSRRPAARI